MHDIFSWLSSQQAWHRRYIYDMTYMSTEQYTIVIIIITRICQWLSIMDFLYFHCTNFSFLFCALCDFSFVWVIASAGNPRACCAVWSDRMWLYMLLKYLYEPMWWVFSLRRRVNRMVFNYIYDRQRLNRT